MLVAVAVVGQEHQLVLPFAGLGMFDILDGFSHNSFGFGQTIHRESSHGYVHAAGYVCFSLVIVEETEIVVCSICIGLFQRVLCLISQQPVVTGCG